MQRMKSKDGLSGMVLTRGPLVKQGSQDIAGCGRAQCQWYSHDVAGTATCTARSSHTRTSSSSIITITISSSRAAAAHQRSRRLLLSTTADAPALNRQLGSSMDLLFPKYQFWVMFSVLTTRA
jgi:hypothetical protein